MKRLTRTVGSNNFQVIGNEELKEDRICEQERKL